MTIEERFEKLEKQSRRLRRLSLASLALALAALIGGTALSVRAYTGAIEPQSITAIAITLKDSSGKTRLILDGNNGSVGVYDFNGKLRALMNYNGVISSFDENGKMRTKLSSDGTVTAHDPNGVTRVTLYPYDNRIYFRNASGQIVAAYP